MSASPVREFKPFTPEERASFLAYRFGSTLDWASRILVAIDYPYDLRWFVDAVQGVCKGKERRIAHATLATRAQRFKNPSQAKSLAIRAVEANNEWARIKRMMIVDIERPKPGEREGKEKRARTRYTDYLTPAAVWAQEAEQRAKKADEIKWKKDSKYRFTVREGILKRAVEQLPSFGCVEDMPPATAAKKDTEPLPLSDYVAARESIMLAEHKRILGKLQDGQPTDIDEIDARLAALEVYYARTRMAVEKGYESARAALLSLRDSRCRRMMDFSDPDEVVAEVDEILAAKGNAHDTLSTYLLSGNDSTKGVAHDTLSTPPEGYEEILIEEELQPDSPPLSQLDCALSYAALGLPVFPTKPNKAPYTARGFKEATTDPATIKSWWTSQPDAGIGIPTGKASGWLVLDRDDRHSGDASLTALIEEYGELPATSEATTPSGGAHYIFKYPKVQIGNSAGKLGRGLDVRGEGGYIVAPGIDPARRWVNALDPVDTPHWMIAALLSEKHEPVNTDRKVLHYPTGQARVFADGERNNGLRDVACGRWTHGYATDVNDLYQQLREVRDTRCAPGKDLPATDEQLWGLAQRTSRRFARGERQQEART